MYGFELLKRSLKKALPLNWYFTVRSAFYRVSNAAFKPYFAEFNCMGFPFKIMIKDRVAQEWYGHATKTGTLPPAVEILWLQELIQKSQMPAGLLARFESHSCTVFDLGAHQGVVAMLFEKLFAAQGKVVALEAGTHNFKVLNENLKLNQSKNVIAMYRAAGRQPGFIEFDESMNGEVSSVKMPALSSKVEVSTIDGLSTEFGHPDLVVVDVEGFEQPVLEGGSAVINSCKTVFAIEIHHDHQRARYGSDLAQIKALFPVNSRFIIGYPESGRMEILLGSEWLNKKDKFFLIVVPA